MTLEEDLVFQRVLSGLKFYNTMELLNNNFRKIKIAIIGCGRISKKHVIAILSEYKRCELVAICDNNKQKIEDICNFYKSKSK